jgi:transcriptional regulator of acetoin/glycerol metabolism
MLLHLERGRVVDLRTGDILAEEGAMSPSELLAVRDAARAFARSEPSFPRYHHDLPHHPDLARLAEASEGVAVAVLLPVRRRDRVAEVIYLDARSSQGPVEPGVRQAVEFLLARASADRRPRGADPDLHRWLIPDDLAGAHPRIVSLRSALERQVTARTPVLLEGSEGVGKSRAARILHDGRTPEGPFVARCGRSFSADPGRADELRAALAEARGGTLYVTDAAALSGDEIRLLLAGTPGVTRVLLAVTTSVEGDLVRERALAEGVGPLATLGIPDLADRGEDVHLLARDLLREITDRDGSAPPTFTAAGRASLQSERWSGNVDELRARLVRAMALTDPGQPLDAPQLRRDSDDTDGSTRPAPPDSFRVETDRSEHDLIDRALRSRGWNVSQAARDLGISRQHLHNLVKKHGLHRTRGRS